MNVPTIPRIARALPTLVCALATLVVACGGEDEAPATGGPPGGGGAPPALVALDAARPGVLDDTWTYLGQVRPKQEVTLASGVSARVESVVGRVGDRVEAGAELIVLDTTTVGPRIAAAKADVGRIRADLAQAVRESERADTLASPIMTDAEKDRYRAKVAALRAQSRAASAMVDQLEAERERHVIAAPFAGTVRARLVEPGAWVNPGQAILELVSTDDLEIIVDVAQDLQPHLEAGGPATLLGQPPVQASVVGLVEALDPKTRTLRVRLEPTQMAPWLIPNRPAEVGFPVTNKDDGAVVVSRDAIVQGPVNSRVIKAVGDQATPILVQILATAGADALVKGDGLAPGDMVVVRGNDRLRPGQPIRVQEDAPPKGAAAPQGAKGAP